MSTRSVNKVVLLGNLTRDPELRYTPQGTAVCSFGLATNREWISEGTKKEAADFHNVVAWSKLAELCDQLLSKGSKVYVEGRLQTRDWMNDQGEKRYKTEVVIDEMILLGGGRGASGSSDEAAFKEQEDNQESSQEEDDIVEDVNLDDILDDANFGDDDEEGEEE